MQLIACSNLLILKKKALVKLVAIIKLTAIFLLTFCMYSSAKGLVPVKITGKVTNDKGEPLSGATVTEKGTVNTVGTKDGL